MSKKKSYGAEDIKVLSDREHVRYRTQIYLGSLNPTVFKMPLFIDDKFLIEEMEFIPAVYKAVGEIIDNSIDEFSQIDQKNKVLSIDAEPLKGIYTISDNGRGIPIDKHSSGKYTPEVALGSLRAGRNFTDDKEAGVIGQNGVGSACTNFCSRDFKATVYRDSKRYIQTFENGADKISKPRITDIASGKTGTEVSFTLDSSVFKDISLPEKLMHNRAIELALTNPGVAVQYNKQNYKFKKGFEDIIKVITKDGEYFEFTIDTPTVTGQFFVVFGVNKNIDEQVFTWVNSSFLFDGGLCNTQFLNAFYDHAISHLVRAAKKNNIEVTKNDVREGLLIFGNLKIKNPEYDAQSKTRLTGPNIRKELNDILDAQWSVFARKNKDWFDKVLERAIHRHNFNENKKAIDDHQKSLRRKVPKLMDATSKNRFECQVLITEGDSAKSKISEAREPTTTAAFPLSGKVNNVYGATPAQLLNMGKLTDLLAVIGLVPGKKAIRSELRYGKVVIATDADVDGSDIFTLLVNMFYHFWPEMFDPEYEPLVHRLVAPNVCLVKGKERIHFTSRADYEKVKDKYKGYEVRYYKGLGSMAKQDWEMILSGKTNTLIPVVDDGKMGQTLELLFSPDADKRKEWLQKDD